MWIAPVRKQRQQGRTPNALLEYVIDFHRPMGGAKSVRKGSQDCHLIKSEEEPQIPSVQFLIKDVPINQLFKIGKASRKNIFAKIDDVEVGTLSTHIVQQLKFKLLLILDT